MLSLRRIKSEAALLPTPAGYISHATLTAQDVPALLSRMACLEAELREATLHAHLSQNVPSSALSSFCLPSSRIFLRQPQLLSESPHLAREHASAQTELSKALSSLPLMKIIVDIAEKYDALGTTNGLEDELLFALSEAIQEPSSPWSTLMPKPPPVVGPRTPEQYLCALDMAIAARKETKLEKKMTKYWKRLALQANSSDEVVLLTPSPSDISDTGLSELLSSPRKDRMEELLAKRRAIILDSAGNILNSDMVSRELDVATPSRHLQVLDFDECASSGPRCSDSASDARNVLRLSQESDMSGVDEFDRTLVESSGGSPTRLAKTSIPSLIRHKAPPVGSTSPPEHAVPPKNLHKPHNCCINPGSAQSTSRRTSNVSFTSVQTKRRMYESLASSPSPSPVLRIPSSSRTPVTSPRSVHVHGITRNAHPRNVSPKSAHSPTISALPRTIVAKPNMNTQHGAALTVAQRGTTSQLKSSTLPRALHKLLNSPFVGKLPPSVPLSGQACS